MQIVIAIAILGGLGLVFGLVLAAASMIFYVESDPRLDQLNVCLPGANCGGCGFPGCDGYAQAVADGKALGYAHYLNNPWFQLYPDIGNLSAWDNDVQMELQAGIGHIVAVHVKDTKPGVFKNVPFGEGVVDFERCFETLKQSGYCGPYLIEMWSETAEDPAAEVAKARDWVKARMAKAGMVEAA